LDLSDLLSWMIPVYTGNDPDVDAASYGIHLAVVSLPEAKKGFVILPRRWRGTTSG
jgi:hypothetical protein